MRGGDEIVARFFDRFGGHAAPNVFWAPGRVNLIGDHIDYCGGTVLPMPIQFGTTVAVRLNDVGRVRGVSLNASEVIDVARADATPLPIGSWGRFLSGAIAVLADDGIEIPGVDVMVGGAIPGSGLSSSASLSVVLLHAFACLVERPTGAAASGESGAARRTRARRRALRPDGSGGDRAGRAGLRVVVRLFRAHASIDPVRRCVGCAGRGGHGSYTAVGAFRVQRAARRDTNERRSALGVDPAAFARVDARQAAIVRTGHSRRSPCVAERGTSSAKRRASSSAAAALESRDWTTLGALLSASHESLRGDYEVSCPELDALSNALAAQPGCYGARMTGAGFGGSVVALFDTAATAVRDGACERKLRRAIRPCACMVHGQISRRRAVTRWLSAATTFSPASG